MTFASKAAAVKAAVAATFWVDASYTPVGGSAVTIKAGPVRKRDIVNLGDVGLAVDGQCYRVMASAVAAPAAGDTLVIDPDGEAETRIVQGKPEPSFDRLMWLLDTRAG